MNYFVLLNDERKGPYTLKELAQKYITSDVLVWHEGMDNWKKAEDLEELKPIIRQMPPPPPHFKLLKNWFTEAIAITIASALLGYFDIFQLCIVAVPFGCVAIFKALKVEEFQRRRKDEEARHFANEARKWTVWCAYVLVVACLFAVISNLLLFSLRWS